MVLNCPEGSKRTALRISHRCSILKFLSDCFRIERNIPDADYIHCHSAKAHSLALWAEWLKVTDVPLIVHRRVDFKPSSGWLTKLKYLSAHVHFYIAISNCISKILSGYGIPGDRIRQVYSGVDFDYLNQIQVVDPRQVFPGIGSRRIFVNIGALTDHKGQIFLLEAAKILKEKRNDFCVVICGDGELKQDFQNYIEQHQLTDIVYMAGFRADAHGILKGSDFFVMPSHLEGLGTTVLDAMGMKIPVIAAEAGGLSEMVVNHKTGFLVPPRDPQALATVMDELLNQQPETLRNLSESACLWAREHFAYQKMGKDIYELYLYGRRNQ